MQYGRTSRKVTQCHFEPQTECQQIIECTILYIKYSYITHTYTIQIFGKSMIVEMKTQDWAKAPKNWLRNQ